MKSRWMIPFVVALLPLAACDDDDTTVVPTADAADTTGGDAGDVGTTDVPDTVTGDVADAEGDAAEDAAEDVADIEDTATGDAADAAADAADTTGDAADGAGGTPRGKDNPPTPGAQIDRTGRPAISTALIGTFEDTAAANALKDEYNAAAPAKWTDYPGPIASALGIYDALDTICGNQLLAGPDPVDGRYNALATVLADDRLLVNSESGTCTQYLGVEAQGLGAVADGGCGGRAPSYDVIETSYSALAAGTLTGVDDGVTTDDGGSQDDTFPFLGAPKP